MRLVCMPHRFRRLHADDNGNWVFNNENGVAGLKLMVDSIQNGNADPGSINYTDREVLNPFMAGDIPFVLNWAFAYALANDPAESTIAGNVGIGLVPPTATAWSAPLLPAAADSLSPAPLSIRITPGSSSRTL